MNNYTYKQIWLINFPVMMSILMEQLINITDAVFLGHVGEVELGASALAGIYYLAIYMLGFGFSIGLQVMIARKTESSIIRRPDEYSFRDYCSCRGWQSCFVVSFILLLRLF